jgi:hypothetical protein
VDYEIRVLSWKFVLEAAEMRRHAALQIRAMAGVIAVACILPDGDFYGFLFNEIPAW